MPKHKREFIDPDVAEMIAADLPDGAYFAMMEELTGMEPAELAEPEPKKRRRRK